MKRNIPPLNAIKVFEEAARHSCFKSAADALFVTQSAVSKQIQLLESHLGTVLFTRQQSGVRLTEEGKQYYGSVRHSLDVLESASEPFLKGDDKDVLTFNALPSMTVTWLFPRVEQFCKRYPNLIFRMNSNDENKPWEDNGADITLLCSKRNDAQMLDSELLLSEELIIIASPEMMKKSPISSFSDLANHSLIGLINRDNIWTDLFKMHDLEIQNDWRYTFQHFYMVINATLNHLGVGLVPRFLCEGLLKSKKLVNPFGFSYETDYGLYIKIPAHKQRESKCLVFSDWIRREIEAK
jgi:LysR family glycine cleavage system transcriptional activator